MPASRASDRSSAKVALAEVGVFVGGVIHPAAARERDAAGVVAEPRTSAAVVITFFATGTVATGTVATGTVATGTVATAFFATDTVA